MTGTITYNWENLRILSIMILGVIWLLIFNLSENDKE